MSEKTSTFAIGVAIERPKFEFDKDLDTTFRIICMYDVATDAIMTRIDVKYEESQFNAAFFSSATSVLKLPSPGIAVAQIALRANKKDLAEALRKLAETLDDGEN